MSRKSTLLHFYIVHKYECNTISGKSTFQIFCIVRRHPMSGKSTLLSFLYCAKTSNDKKVYIAIILYCAKTSNDRKVYIAIIVLLCENIQCQESLHCYQFCIVERHPMTGNFTFQSFFNCAKTSNNRKAYVSITL